MTRREFAKKLRQRFRRMNGYVNPLPEDADDRLALAESTLGFALPAIVCSVFRYAGEDFINPEWSVEKYLSWRRDPRRGIREHRDGQPENRCIIAEPVIGRRPVWPVYLMPIAEEGCGIWICVDCSRKQAPVISYRGDYMTGDTMELPLEHVSPSYVEWLRNRIPRDDGGYADDA